ncbi:MAG: hypothetical protein KZQ77_00915 [Candidatus Thiodiazotropha sp. (ex Notomyrtea botanica)]|nr:hypothetical protein [Candidatus Thiodiazotropha sp. (ex Notomyrtea botanica)]
MKQRAIRLQEETGSDLEELDPDMLNKVLGYASESVLFLSPGDSIVEAIRCAVELDIPVYGVDLEEVADSERHQVLIRDTGDITAADVPAWVSENLDLADWCRDEVVDARREMAMAARLKTVIQKHGNVLFTCGAAHWRKIQRLLQNESVRPAVVDYEVVTSREFTRLITHPALAIHFLDPFPPWIENVEKNRESADTAWRDEDAIRSRKIRPQQMLHGLIEVAYAEFLRQSAVARQEAHGKGQDSYAINHFTTLLENLSVLENRVAPDLFSVFSAANGTVSPEFTDILAQKFFNYDWVDPEEFRLPVLLMIGAEPNVRMKAQVIDVNGSKGREFYLNNIPGYSVLKNRNKVPCPEDLETCYVPPESDELGQMPKRLRGKDVDDDGGYSMLRTWDPIDNLFGLMCSRAMTLARFMTEQKVSLPFEGALYDGICIKSMVRAAAIGDERIYVRQSRRIRGQPEIPERNIEPIVWLFDPSASGAEWSAYSESLLRLKRHCNSRGLDPRVLESLVAESGENYLAGMTYGTSEQCEDQYQRAGIELKLQLKGVVYFIPPICSESEDLEWMRQADFRNVPIVPKTDIKSIVEVYRNRYQVKFDRENWVSTMIGLAIPYARSSVIVVAPHGFMPDQSVMRVARKLGKSIALVPSGHFSDSVIKRLQTNYGVHRRDTPAGEVFSSLAMRLLGDDPDSYRDMVPDWLCDRIGRPRH